MLNRVHVVDLPLSVAEVAVSARIRPLGTVTGNRLPADALRAHVEVTAAEAVGTPPKRAGAWSLATLRPASHESHVARRRAIIPAG
jgi:hypothetical protein